MRECLGVLLLDVADVAASRVNSSTFFDQHTSRQWCINPAVTKICPTHAQLRTEKCIATIMCGNCKIKGNCN